MTLIRTIEGTPLDFSPNAHIQSAGGGRVGVDPAGNTVVRGQVLTDEGGYRTNFSGSSLDISVGTCTFTNGSTVVTGTSFDTYNMHAGDYIKLKSDPNSAYAQIEYIISPTELKLITGYTGSSGTGNTGVSIVKLILGTGASLALNNYGIATVSSGTISGSLTEIERDVDFLPIIKQSGVAISQRLSDQIIYIGAYDEELVTPKYWAWFKFMGTDITSVRCETAYNKETSPSIYETEFTDVKLPNNLTTNSSNRYRVEILVDKVRFLINGVVVAEHFKSIPTPYSLLTSTIRIVNTNTLTTSTIVNVDYDCVQNFNKVMTSPVSDSDPTPAASAELETIVTLLQTLVSRTPVPDPTGRSRVTIETATAYALSANQSVNVAQIGAVSPSVGFGPTNTGTLRIAPTNEQLLLPPTSLQTIYNNITVS